VNPPPPGPLPALRPLARRDRDVAHIARRWRELTSGRGPGGRLGPGELTLLACSGGADSSALALALRAATDRLVLAHVVHDMRPTPEALADRDAVRSLAGALSLPFVEAHVGVAHGTIDAHPVALAEGGRNAEAGARRLRYLALQRLAASAGVRFVATGHHAGDQLETMLMALARGAGPRGLRGVAPSRPIVPGSSIRVIRPLLELPRASCERLCADAAWAWRTDRTNADTSRLRSFLRHRVIPELRSVRPAIEQRAGATAQLMSDAAVALHARAASLLDAADPTTPGELAWARAALRMEPAAVLGELLLLAAIRVAPSVPHAMPARARTGFIVTCIRSPRPHARTCRIGGMTIEVGPRLVVVRGAAAAP
jgi:tRNA(Ile)-lysidine synthase